MTELFTGVGVALVTIFGQDGDPDPVATGGLARDLANRGMRAVLACGTTGEAQALGDAERAEIIEAVRAAVPADIPVLAGTGAEVAHYAGATYVGHRRCWRWLARSVPLARSWRWPTSSLSNALLPLPATGAPSSSSRSRIWPCDAAGRRP